MREFIAYYRVSTKDQIHGLDAQREQVANYLKTNGGKILFEFTERESGTDNERPELTEALRKCRLMKTTLLVAKLDRLSRSVAFLADLQDSKVDFICADMPEANRLTVGMLSVVAQHEVEMIRARTKAGLKAAKAKGVKLGNPNGARCLRPHKAKALAHSQAANRKLADGYLADMRQEFESRPGMTDARLADSLNDAGLTTRHGKRFSRQSAFYVRKELSA